MVGLFSKEEVFCTICKRGITHKHKPKRSWNVEGPVCANCYVDLMKKYYESGIDDICAICGDKPRAFNLWKPYKEWGIKGWLCKPCFDEKEKADEESKKYCAMCGNKLGFFCYPSTKDSGITGEICKTCHNLQKTKTGS